jgi:hypothetical protein
LYYPWLESCRGSRWVTFPKSFSWWTRLMTRIAPSTNKYVRRPKFWVVNQNAIISVNGEFKGLVPGVSLDGILFYAHHVNTPVIEVVRDVFTLDVIAQITDVSKRQKVNATPRHPPADTFFPRRLDL